MSTKKENLTTNENEEVDELEQTTAITALSTKEQRFVHLYLTGQYTIPKLASLLEVAPNTLWRWLKRPAIKSIIEEMQLTTHDIVAMQLKNLTLKATNKLSGLIDSPVDGVALQAVKDVLDRSGHKAKQEIKVEKTVTTYEQRLNNLINEIIDVNEEDAQVINAEEEENGVE